MIAAVFGALLLAGATPRPRCDLSRLEACSSGNDLVGDDKFASAVARFLGHRRGGFFHSGDVALQVLDGLAGPPDLAHRLSGGEWLFPGCQAHDCPNKSVVILSGEGRILAVALLNSRCGDDCDISTRHLDVFALDAALQLGLARVLDGWARETTARDIKEFGARLVPPYAGMAIHPCGPSCAKPPLARK